MSDSQPERSRAAVAALRCLRVLVVVLGGVLAAVGFAVVGYVVVEAAVLIL